VVEDMKPNQPGIQLSVVGGHEQIGVADSLWPAQSSSCKNRVKNSGWKRRRLDEPVNRLWTWEDEARPRLRPASATGEGRG
jgi:hypothetical protein